MEEDYIALFKTMRASRNREVTHEACLSDLMTQISRLADIQTGSGHSADVMAKTIDYCGSQGH